MKQLISYHGLVAYRGKHLVNDVNALYERALTATSTEGVCYATRPIGTIGVKTQGDHMAAFNRDCGSKLHPVFGRVRTERSDTPCDEPYYWCGELEMATWDDVAVNEYVEAVECSTWKISASAEPLSVEAIKDFHNKACLVWNYDYMELWSSDYQTIVSVWVKNYASPEELETAERLADMLGTGLEVVAPKHEREYALEVYDPSAVWVADEGVETLMATSRSRFCMEWE